MALGFLTTRQGNLGLPGHPGPFSLGTPGLGSLHPAQPVAGQHSSSFRGSYALP